MIQYQELLMIQYQELLMIRLHWLRMMAWMCMWSMLYTDNACTISPICMFYTLNMQYPFTQNVFTLITSWSFFFICTLVSLYNSDRVSTFMIWMRLAVQFYFLLLSFLHHAVSLWNRLMVEKYAYP
jgi:hypothetical protein